MRIHGSFICPDCRTGTIKAAVASRKHDDKVGGGAILSMNLLPQRTLQDRPLACRNLLD